MVDNSIISDVRYGTADTVNFDPTKVDEDLGMMKEGSRTDAEVVAREEEAIKVDSLSVAQLKEIREKAQKHAFQVSLNYLKRLLMEVIESIEMLCTVFLRWFNLLIWCIYTH